MELWTAILSLVAPLIKQLIESKVVPALKRKIYQTVDKETTEAIEDLIKLKIKIDKEEDPKKRERHLHGFELGLKTLETVSEKLNKAILKLRDENLLEKQ